MILMILRGCVNISNSILGHLAAEVLWQWPLSEAQSLMNLFQAADDEGRGEKDIIEIFDEFVKKLQRTNEDVRKNNPRKKYDLQASVSKQVSGSVNNNKTDTCVLEIDTNSLVKQGNYGPEFDKKVISAVDKEEEPKTKKDDAVPETESSLLEKIQLMTKDLETITKEKNESGGRPSS